MSTPERTQTVRNAWINRLRDEALHARRLEVSRCVHIGILIATYADADGSNAFPGGRTLAAIAGCSEETITRAVKVLMAVGLLRRRRRPNQSSMYQLVLPVGGGRLPWGEHLHHYTDTRQARRKRALKEQQETAARLASRNPLRNGVPEPGAERCPEPVPAGGSGHPAGPAGTRSGTGADPGMERVPDPGAERGDQYIPTYGRDPDPDHDGVAHRPQPPVRAGARSGNEHSPPDTDGAGRPLRKCRCGIPLIRTTRDACTRCERAASGTREARPEPVQGVFLASLPSASGQPAPGLHGAAQPRPHRSGPLRVCACGRQHRNPDPTSRCPDCLHAEQDAREAASGT